VDAPLGTSQFGSGGRGPLEEAKSAELH
jgi:hypothetical protein